MEASEPVPERPTPSAQWFDDPNLRERAMRLLRDPQIAAKQAAFAERTTSGARRGKTAAEIMQEIRNDLEANR